MKIAYFDCFSGISGDMVLGSLIDAGLKVDVLTNLIDELGVSNCSINVKKVKRGGISATKVDVIYPSEEKRAPAAVLTIFDRLNLPESVKNKSKKIFLDIAKVEAKIHKEDISSIHLHELGSLDTIIDIVGSVLGMCEMGIEKVYASPINVGGGKVKTAHGILPVPAPATAELLKEAPIYSSGVEAELTTPTGAAILTGFSPLYGPIPPMKLEKIGYGAGEKNFSSFPNVLRILIGEKETLPCEDQVVVLETNIDDMNPEIYEHVIDLLFKKGALDVFLTPVQMKKSRPGVLLSVVCEEGKEEDLLNVIFTETTTLGIRISKMRRRKLERKIKKLKTSLGEIKVKVSIQNNKIIGGSPEYEDCKKIAIERNLPLKKVYEIVRDEISLIEGKKI